MNFRRVQLWQQPDAKQPQRKNIKERPNPCRPLVYERGLSKPCQRLLGHEVRVYCA